MQVVNQETKDVLTSIKTKMAKSCTEPEWNESFIVDVKCSESFPLLLSIELQQKGMGKLKFMGKLDLPLQPLLEDDCNDSFSFQKKTESDEVAGELLLGLSYASETKPRKIKIEQSLVVQQSVTSQPELVVQAEGEEYPFDLPDTEDNATFEDAERKKLAGATLVKLVEKMTDTPQNSDLIDTVLLTHASYTTSQELLRLLFKRYKGPMAEQSDTEEQRSANEHNKKSIQLRVQYVMERWYALTDDLLRADVCNILYYELAEGTFDEKKNLKEFLDEVTQLQAQDKFRLPATSIVERKNSIKALSAFPVIFEYTTNVIAEQITLIEHSNYLRVKPTEFLRQAWSKKPESCPGAMGVINWFNKMSQWAATEIIKGDTPENRAIIISKFIEIAARCRELGNFGGVMEILSALHNSAISRLKKTWAFVPKEKKESFDTLSKLMSPMPNFKNYREEYSKTKLPWLPYLGIHLTDLTFIDDGNETFLDSNKTVINVQKAKLLATTIKTILTSSSIPYEGLSPSSTIQRILSTVEFFEDHEIYRISKLKEESLKKGEELPQMARGSLASAARTMMKKKDVSSVAKDLTDKDWKLILGGAKEVKFPKDVVVVEEGKLNQNLYRVKSGAVRVEKGSRTEPVVVATMKEDSVFGEMSVILPQHNASATVVSDEAVIHVIPIELIYSIFEQQQDLASRFYLNIANKLAGVLTTLNPKSAKSKEEARENNMKESGRMLLDQEEGNKEEVQFAKLFDFSKDEVIISQRPAVYKKKNGTLIVTNYNLHFYAEVFMVTNKKSIAIKTITSLSSVKTQLKVDCKSPNSDHSYVFDLQETSALNDSKQVVTNIWSKLTHTNEPQDNSGQQPSADTIVITNTGLSEITVKVGLKKYVFHTNQASGQELAVMSGIWKKEGDAIDEEKQELLEAMKTHTMTTEDWDKLLGKI